MLMSSTSFPQPSSQYCFMIERFCHFLIICVKLLYWFDQLALISSRLSTVIPCQVIADKESMEEDLQRYISLNTYLDSEDPWFWQKLRYSLMYIFHSFRPVQSFSEDNHCYKM